MDFSWLNQIILSHTILAYLLVGFISLLESLAFVGLFIPGTIMMFFIGTLVGTGSLELYPTLLSAALGAIVGDSLSYSLGAYFHDNLKKISWLQRYHYLLAKGETFFYKHGGKSIVFGRFVGPVRPIIPVVAGMLDMPKNRFLVTNVLSALLWSPAYTLPGVFFGTSLTLLGQISTRLAIVFLLAFAIFFLTNILIKKLVYCLEKIAHSVSKRLQEWTAGEMGNKRLKTGKRLIQQLFFPQKDEDFFITFLVLICVVFFWIFFWIYVDSLMGKTDIYTVTSLNNLIQSLRTPWADSFFVVLHNMGSIAQTTLVTFCVLLVLLFARARQSTLYWFTVILGGITADLLISSTCPVFFLLNNPSIPESLTWYQVSPFLNITCYGSLAILLTRATRSRSWWTYFWTALLITTLTACSKLYLERSNLLILISQISIGWTWTALLGIVFLRSKKETLPLSILKTGPLICLIAGTLGLSKINHQQLVQKFKPAAPIQTLTLDQWLKQDWKKLPLYRLTVSGHSKQPLIIQYAGPIDTLRNFFIRHGWQRPPKTTLRSWFYTLSPRAQIENLPILPHLHQGYPEKLFLIKKIQGKEVVLHVWPSGFILKGWKTDRIPSKTQLTGQIENSLETVQNPACNGLVAHSTPLWVGTMVVLKKRRLVNLLFLAMDSKDYTLPVLWLEKNISRSIGQDKQHTAFAHKIVHIPQTFDRPPKTFTAPGRTHDKQRENRTHLQQKIFLLY